MIDELIKQFMMGRSFDADDVYCQCWDVSQEFIHHLKGRGFEVEPIFLRDNFGIKFENVHPFWGDTQSFTHNVVLVDGFSYDFTYRQFVPDSPVPYVQTVEELKSKWRIVIGEKTGLF